MRDTQFIDLVPHDIIESKTPKILDQKQENEYQDEGLMIFKRDIQNRIRYFWYRNDELLDPNREHGFLIFQNGTLKITDTLRANGIFRCKAKGWHKEIGAVISTACHVRQAGK